MAASKKTFPFSRLRFHRSRKNGPTDSRKPFSRSSYENSSSTRHHFYPPYFTVDDLASCRRKRYPEKQPRDTLRPLSGKFSNLKSEYKKKFRSFVLIPEMSCNSMNWKKKKLKIIKDLKLIDEIECQPKFIDDCNRASLRRPSPFKPVDHLEPDPVPFANSTENKDQFILFKEARRAALARPSANLKVEGKFEGVTETRAKYKEAIGAKKSELLRRNTTLKIDGNFDFLTEKNEKFKEVHVPRTKLLRRFSSLEIPKDVVKVTTEYRDAFHVPQHVEPPRRVRSLDHLHLEGKMELEPEYNRSFIDFHVSHPDVKFKSKKKGKDDDHMYELLNPSLKIYSPEYRHSFVGFQPTHLPFKRPRTNLSPSHGIEETESELHAKYKQLNIGQKTPLLRPNTHLHQEGKIDLTPEYNKSFINYADYLRKKKKEQWIKKSFDTLELSRAQLVECKPSRSADVRFQKGKRLPANVKKDGDATGKEVISKIIMSEKPSFRLEVTNPDQVQKPFERSLREHSFVVLNENNNNDANKWIKNKERRRWSPSWTENC